jgi:hypothetical protein
MMQAGGCVPGPVIILATVMFDKKISKRTLKLKGQGFRQATILENQLRANRLLLN